MLSTLKHSEVLEIIFVAVGVILLLKRVVDMDNYHKTRVVVLTLILSGAAMLLFDKLGLRIGDSGLSHCVVNFDDLRHNR